MFGIVSTFLVFQSKLKIEKSQVNVDISRHETSTKSKIRRRRTRRQTRVEVASGDFSDIPGLTRKSEGNGTMNVFENEVEDDGMPEDDSLERTIPEEVTLADIELMKCQKQLNLSRMSELMSGEPQYV